MQVRLDLIYQEWSVERWAIDRLIPYAKNARTHTDAQVAAIAASIKEWGWTTPALVGEDGGLIAGHARILAARQPGIAEIPVMVAARKKDGLSKRDAWPDPRARRYPNHCRPCGSPRGRLPPPSSVNCRRLRSPRRRRPSAAS